MNDHVSPTERRAALVTAGLLAAVALLAFPLRAWRLGASDAIVGFASGVAVAALIVAAALAFRRARSTGDSSYDVLALGLGTAALPPLATTLVYPHGASIVGDQVHAWLGVVGQAAIVGAVAAYALAHTPSGRRRLEDARAARALALGGVALVLGAVAAIVGFAHALPTLVTSHGTTPASVAVVGRLLAVAGVVAVGALVATTMLARPLALWSAIALVALVAGDLADGQAGLRHFTFPWYVGLACALVAPVALLVAQFRDLADASAGHRADDVRTTDRAAATRTAAARTMAPRTIVAQTNAVEHAGASPALSPFARTLTDALAQTRSANQPLALLLLDLDGFADYNAHFGTHAGDEALRAVESAISSVCFRTTDAWCRVESDTYAAILRSSDLDDAQGIAENLREAILRLRIEGVPGGRHDVLTTSIGYAIVEPSAVADARAIADAAARALDRARLLGGNRIATYDRPREARLVAV